MQSCSNYRELMCQIIKIWGKTVKDRLRRELMISKQQYAFIPRKNTTEAMLVLSVLMEKYRKGLKE